MSCTTRDSYAIICLSGTMKYQKNCLVNSHQRSEIHIRKLHTEANELKSHVYITTGENGQITGDKKLALYCIKYEILLIC